MVVATHAGTPARHLEHRIELAPNCSLTPLTARLFIASLALEGRYGRPGAPTDVPPHAWELTNERFIDDETGQLLEVWIDPLTGERRYEPAGGDPRLPDLRP